MTHPNTLAYSAGTVCCPTESSARRHDRAGWRATWHADEPNALVPAGRICGPVQIEGLGEVHVSRIYITPLDADGAPVPQRWSGRRWTR